MIKHDKLEMKYVATDSCEPNSWNAQAMDTATFDRLKTEIAENGFIVPMQVVPLDNGKYRIIGGEHRWLAAKELGIEEVPVTVLSEKRWADSDLQKFVTVRLNILSGKLDSEKFVKLYTEMADKYGADSLQSLMGFCLAAGTIVETESGPKRIEDIRIGELVFNGLGQLEPVTTKREEFYRGPMLRLHATKIRKPLEVTPGHHLFVAERDWSKNRRQEFKGVVEVFAEDAQVGDGLLIPRLRGQGSLLRVPTAVTEKQTRQQHGYRLTDSYEVTADLAWLIGLYAADGSCDPRTAHVSVALGASESEYIARTCAALKATFGLEPVLQGQGQGCVEVRVFSRRLAEAMGGWFGADCYEKRLPGEVMSLKPELQEEVLMGYLAGDGSEGADGDWYAQTVSQGLAVQLVRLAASLGYRFSMSEIPARVDKRGVRYASSYNLWFKKDPKRYSAAYDGTPVGVIEEVETFQYDGLVFDLGLSNEHSYIAGGFRVGNTDSKAFAKALGGVKKALKQALPPEMHARVDEAAKEAKSVADLGNIIQMMFAQYGETVALSFMVFTYGKQEHLYIQMDKPTKKAMDKVINYCRATGEDINSVLASVAQQWAKEAEKRLDSKKFSKNNEIDNNGEDPPTF